MWIPTKSKCQVRSILQCIVTGVYFCDVLGGGKDLASAAIFDSKEARSIQMKLEEESKMNVKTDVANAPANSKFTMPNFPQGYDMMRNPS